MAVKVLERLSCGCEIATDGSRRYCDQCPDPERILSEIRSLLEVLEQSLRQRDKELFETTKYTLYHSVGLPEGVELEE